MHVIKGCKGAVAREIPVCMLKILYLALNSDFSNSVLSIKIGRKVDSLITL